MLVIFYSMYRHMYTLCVCICVYVITYVCAHAEMYVCAYACSFTLSDHNMLFLNAFQPKGKGPCDSCLNVFSKSLNHCCNFVPK